MKTAFIVLGSMVIGAVIAMIVLWISWVRDVSRWW